MWKRILAFLAVLHLAQPALAAPCTEPGSLVDARTSAKGKREFAVFTFKKPAAIHYTVEAAMPPFTEDPGGNTIQVAGSKFTRVTFNGVSWMCEIREAFHTPRQAIIDVKRTGQFEGVVGYVIGRSASSHFINVYSFDTPSSRVVVVKFRR